MTEDIKHSEYQIGVIGAGSWGTALAQLLGVKGYKLDLWVFEPEVREQIESARENIQFLPGIRLSENITPSNDLKKVASGKNILLIVVPSHCFRNITTEIAPSVSCETILVTASKGIENKTFLTMSEILSETLPEIPLEQKAVLSGPSFAKEVATHVPTAVTVASVSQETAQKVQQIFATPSFRVYTSDDIIGTQLGGAVKNVIAIATGIVDGMNLGLNTRAALITRGQTEIRRLGIHLGANPRTFTGLAGIGDLILTCTGSLSRNYSVGKQIGQGKHLDDILKDMRMVAEGVKTSITVYNLSRKLDVDMPICQGVYRILFENQSPKNMLHQLMTRDLKDELDET